MFDHILVTTDGSALGHLVLLVAADLARTYDSAFTLLYVAPQLLMLLEGAVYTYDYPAERERVMDERAALDTFAQFTEAVGAKSDLLALAGEVIATLRSRFPDASVGCYAEEAGLWKARLWSDNVSANLVNQMWAGFPAQTPMIVQALRDQQLTFTDAWDARRELIERSDK